MRIRTDIKANYRGIFFDGKTIRQRINPSIPISSPEFAENEDVAINNKCFANCPYCYTSAMSTGQNFTNIMDIINKFNPNHDMWFLFSFYENPNWELQEQLMVIADRFHLG